MNNTSVLCNNQIAWNKDNVLSDGMDFIKTTQRELSKLEMLWRHSQDKGFYNNASIDAAKNYKNYAKEASNKMSILNQAALKISKEVLENSHCLTLEKIVSCSSKGVKYLDQVNRDYSYYPTELNKTIHEIWKMVNGLFIVTIPATGVLSLTMWIASWTPPDQYRSPLEVALPIWATCCAIQYFVVEEMLKPSQMKLENAKLVFENSIQS